MNLSVHQTQHRDIPLRRNDLERETRIHHEIEASRQLRAALEPCRSAIEDIVSRLEFVPHWDKAAMLQVLSEWLRFDEARVELVAGEMSGEEV